MQNRVQFHGCYLSSFLIEMGDDDDDQHDEARKRRCRHTPFSCRRDSREKQLAFRNQIAEELFASETLAVVELEEAPQLKRNSQGKRFPETEFEYSVSVERNQKADDSVASPFESP